MRHHQHSPVLVATYGNAMAGNDAFGAMVATSLLAVPIQDVEVIDAGLRPAAVFDYLVDRSALIVVDAAYCPGSPTGQLIDVDWFGEARPPLLHDLVMSTHGLSITDQLVLADRLGMLPPTVRLLAVTVAKMPKVGEAMDESVCVWIPQVVRRIHEIAGALLQTVTGQTNA